MWTEAGLSEGEGSPAVRGNKQRAKPALLKLRPCSHMSQAAWKRGVWDARDTHKDDGAPTLRPKAGKGPLEALVQSHAQGFSSSFPLILHG